MSLIRSLLVLLMMLLTSVSYGETPEASGKKKILVIDSYHREYLWAQETNKGFVNAFLEYKYIDSADQAKTFTQKDFVESSKAVIKKLWMNTKFQNSKKEILQMTGVIRREISRFNPDIIMLGDDNAVNHIGKQYIDTKTPVVFWGVNGLPLKYNLIDTLEHPGHNITGVYQAGYLKETLTLLKELIPEVKTFAILSDNSPTGRAKSKKMNRLAEQGELPIKLIESVVTNSLSTWKAKALELQKRVDAFFILNHNTIKNAKGDSVNQLEIGAWSLRTSENLTPQMPISL